ncbi:hypothetical protein [Helcobacillus massiliensis]|uniref:hypothetical protein n=1 Tax=Helcobacillus massiliensis TaxID=521392 RepID=UPI002552FBC9|nr:hypothetical protein [Helcobacillus massiliensis]MDK7741822.1 hypothetical protein [Helcobacillus massiliensis]WOO92987.1 hypothetical protein R3I40_11390 [Helcobacillus massiliensis]
MGSIADIPLLRDAAVDPSAVREAAGVPMLLSLDTRTVREEPLAGAIPAVLAGADSAGADVGSAGTAGADGGEPHTLTALGSALRVALADGVLLWVTALTPEEHAAWQASDLAPLMRDVTDHSSADSALVVGMAPTAIVRHLLSAGEEQRALLRGWLDGIDTLKVPVGLSRDLADSGVRVRHRSRWERWSRSATVIAYTIVFVYSALRALPVSLVKEFHGSLLTLWAIDLITAFPYTWGVITAVSGTSRRQRIAGLAVTVGTFVAPYVYFWFHGRQYPPTVIVVVVLLIASGVALEVTKYVRTARLSRRLREPSAPLGRTRPAPSAVRSPAGTTTR